MGGIEPSRSLACYQIASFSKMIIVKKGVRDANCIGAQCLVLGRFKQPLAAESPTCLTSAYNGCPAKVDYLTELADNRRKNGLKLEDP
jgi:hypothetical protein